MRKEMESEQSLVRSILLAASMALPFNSIRRDDSRSVYTQTIRTMKRNSDGCADLCGQETEVIRWISDLYSCAHIVILVMILGS
jgi:hypothetical protein